MNRALLAIVGFVTIMVIWVVGARCARASRPDLPTEVVVRLYPLPQEVLTALGATPAHDIFYHIRLSTFRVMLGFTAAAVIALPTGFAIGRCQTVARLFEPANDFLRYLPVAGFSSLAIFLIGAGPLTAILVVFIGTVFHLIVAVADEVRRVPGAYLDLAHTMGFGAYRRLTKIIIPASLPGVFDSLRIAIGWAWSYVTLAEVMGTQGGMGHAIEVSRRYIRTDQVLMWIIIIGMLGVSSDAAMRLVSNYAFRWSRVVAGLRAS